MFFVFRFSKKQAKFQTIRYSSNLFKDDCAKMFARKQHTTSKVCNMIFEPSFFFYHLKKVYL